MDNSGAAQNEWRQWQEKFLFFAISSAGDALNDCEEGKGTVD